MGITTLTSLFSGTGIRAEQTVPFVAFGFEAVVLLTAAFFPCKNFCKNHP
jgi:hypothetical protein